MVSQPCISDIKCHGWLKGLHIEINLEFSHLNVVVGKCTLGRPHSMLSGFF